jgi:molecular chaperone DnaK
MSSSPVLGIDLGTTNSVVALADGTRVQVLVDADGNRLIPSVVSFHPQGDVLVGYAARERRLLDAKNTVYSVKRLIGRPFDSPEVTRARSRFAFDLVEGPNKSVLVKARNETYTLPEISAFVLREVRRVAEQALGQECSRAVITVPANFNELQRAATKAAGKVAGLEVMRILNEPTAAALAYGYGRSRDSSPRGGRERIAVYDFGGGTFDVTILELAGDVFEVVATAGDTFLGGDDVDVLIAEEMAGAFLAHHRFDPRNDAQAYERLRAAAEWSKCQLTFEPEVHLRVEELAYGETGASLDLTFGLSRTALEKLARPLVERSFAVCDDAMRVAGIAPTQLDSVILVGGTTRMPLVRQMVKEYFGQEPETSIDPDLVVSQGAALQGFSLRADRGSMPPSKAVGRVTLKKAGAPDPKRDARRAKSSRRRPRPRGPKQPAFAPREAPAPVPRPVAVPPPPPARATIGRVQPQRRRRADARRCARLPARWRAHGRADARGRQPRRCRTDAAVRAASSVGARAAASLARQGRATACADARRRRPGTRGRDGQERGDRRARQSGAQGTGRTATTAAGHAGARAVGPCIPWAHRRSPSSPRPRAARSRGARGAVGTFRVAASSAAGPSVRASSQVAASRSGLRLASVATSAATSRLAAAATAASRLAQQQPQQAGWPQQQPQQAGWPQQQPQQAGWPQQQPQQAGWPQQQPQQAGWPQQQPQQAGWPQQQPQQAGWPQQAAPVAMEIVGSGAPAPLLLDVTPHTLGVETVSGFCEAVIKRNAAIPVEQTRVFTTANDGQLEVRVRIVQGESRRLEENQQLGEILLSGIRQERRGHVKIGVTFVMDANGTLGVKAKDLESGREQSIRVQLVGAMPDAEIQRMQERQNQIFGQ